MRTTGGVAMDRRSFPVVTVAIGLGAALLALLPAAGLWLRYDRAAVGSWQLWRIVTCHFVHLNGAHLFWDLFALMTLGVFFEPQLGRRFPACLCAGAVVIPLALYLFQADLLGYCGLSGLDTAAYALCGAYALTRAMEEKRPLLAATTIASLAGLALKIGYEVMTGRTLFADPAGACLAPVPLAHVAGGVIGLVFVAVIPPRIIPRWPRGPFGATLHPSSNGRRRRRMISIEKVHLSLGGRPILRGVDLSVKDGECLAVVGPNGCGKSTLLKAIAGIERPDRGEIRMPKGTTVGYLPQETDTDSARPLQEELLGAFVEVQAALGEMARLAEEMGRTEPDSSAHARVMHRYAECAHLVEHADGYALESKVARVAAGLGFSPEDLGRSCRDFSGGWRMRILLAKLLLRKPDVILLDEPTNHLDLESTLWLEDWIERCGRTVVLVSHESATMDRLASRIVCLENGRGEVYTGNYARYLVRSKQRREAEWGAYTRQRRELEELEAFISRFRANAARAGLVQSRVKQLAKIERLEPPFHPTAIHFDFPPSPESYYDVLTLRRLGHSYGETRVFSGIDLAIQRGEKIGLVGVNGAGKSTLLRILAGREAPREGECVVGKKVVSAYFAQYDTDTLSSDATLLETIGEAAPAGQAQRARDLLGAFLFSGDDVLKPLRALSGGERTRFRLARMLFSPANLLLLDEPTNHLDITSRATVEKALIAYTGTVVVVSHDRAFMDRVTKKIVELDRGALRVYPGKYSDYLEHARRMVQGGPGDEPRPRPSGAAPGGASPPAAREGRGAERSLRAAARKLAALEAKIGRHEARIAALDAAMALPENATAYERLAALAEERHALAREHQRMLDEWESLAR